MSKNPPVRQRLRPTNNNPSLRLSDGRFAPGQCGNRKGRPPKQPDCRSAEDRVLEAAIKVSRNGRKEIISTEQAYLEVVFSGALRSDPAMVAIAARFVLARMRRSPARGDQAMADAAEAVAEEAFTDAEAKLYDRILQAERDKGEA